jgi:hypothetical protein
MFDAKAHLRPRSAVGTELVRDHHARGRDCRFQKPPQEPLRRARISSALDQDIENEAILVDGAPKPVLLAGDRDDDFVEMPFVTASGVRWRIRSANALPNFFPHWRTVSWVTQIPRAASISSTIRRLKGNRK